MLVNFLKKMQAQECHYPENACVRNFFNGKQLKDIHSDFTVQSQGFAFVIRSTATIKLLPNSVHVVYLVLVQRLESLKIIISLFLNPN